MVAYLYVPAIRPRGASRLLTGSQSEIADFSYRYIISRKVGGEYSGVRKLGESI